MDVLREVVALDLETTGLCPLQGDRICEAALLKFRLCDNAILERFATLVNPGMIIPARVSLINRISDRMVKGAPLFKDIAGKIHSLLEGNILLVHNADFDIPFLKVEFRLCGMEFPETQVIDTLYLARRFFNFPNNSLSALAEYYHLDTSTMHRAENDAILTYRLFNMLCREPGETPSSKEVYRDTRYIFLPSEGELPEIIKSAISDEGLFEMDYMESSKEVARYKARFTGGPFKDSKNRYYIKALCRAENIEKKFRLDKIIRIVDNVV